jgi:RNA polymerase sigma factor (sigma-70 family)
MDGTNNSELLRRYARDGSEEAFAALVAQYVNLVYSVALRHLGNPHQAEEVSQAVFITLARKARHMHPGTILAGWLHRTAWFTADNSLKTEMRRRRREQEAYVQSQLNESESEADVWAQISPLLDKAIAELNETDRNAIVLRFFGGRPLIEVGAALGMNEEAAKKRVSRAVVKLRAYFARHGIAVSASMIGLAITGNAVQAAPAHLIGSLATSSLAAAGGAGASSLTGGLFQIVLAKAQAKLVLATLAAMLGLAVVYFSWPGALTRASVRRGLVLHFTFDRQEAGGQVTDTSGKGSHGQASGARWTAAGKQGGAYEFAAEGDQIQVPNSALLNPQRLTLAAWIKTSTWDGTWRRIFDKLDRVGYALSIAGDRKDSSWRGRVCLETFNGFCLSQNVVADGQWHHIVAAYDTAGQWLYVDGQRQPDDGFFQAKGPLPANDSNLFIGCNRTSPSGTGAGASFQGLIDEPMVFNRILSPEEVTFLYESSNAR